MMILGLLCFVFGRQRCGHAEAIVHASFSFSAPPSPSCYKRHDITQRCTEPAIFRSTVAPPLHC